MSPKLYTPQEVAEYNRVKKTTLATWRHRGKGPKFVRLNNGTGAVRYLEITTAA